ncbi:MAG: DALR domain-containing protein, partial [Planctomycetota bacterium]
GETFDIHGGGMDLIFPHHENEIAQSESATGQTFAKYWMHHGLTRFNTKKVSKSDPEMQAALERMTLTNLLGQYSGELLRYFVLSTHYRRPIEYSPDELESKRKGLETFYRLFERIERLTDQSVYDAGLPVPPAPQASACADSPAETAPPGLRPAASAEASPAFVKELDDFGARFIEAMDDDFNTAAAIAVLFEQAKAVNRFIETQKLELPQGEPGRPTALWAGRRLVETARLLGLFLAAHEQVAPAGSEIANNVLPVLVEVRARCKKNKDFSTADLIRDRLGAAGVTLEDRAGETTWRLAQRAEEVADRAMDLLIEIRGACKKNKDFATADLIRDGLQASGITLEDRADGTMWRKN